MPHATNIAPQNKNWRLALSIFGHHARQETTRTKNMISEAARAPMAPRAPRSTSIMNAAVLRMNRLGLTEKWDRCGRLFGITRAEDYKEPPDVVYTDENGLNTTADSCLIAVPVFNFVTNLTSSAENIRAGHVHGNGCAHQRRPCPHGPRRCQNRHVANPRCPASHDRPRRCPARSRCMSTRE